MSSSIDPVLLIPSYVHPFPNPVRFPIQMVPKDGPNARPRKKPRWTHLIHQLQKALGPGRRMLRALSRAFLGFAGWSGFVLKKGGISTSHRINCLHQWGQTKNGWVWKWKIRNWHGSFLGIPIVGNLHIVILEKHVFTRKMGISLKNPYSVYFRVKVAIKHWCWQSGWNVCISFISQHENIKFYTFASVIAVVVTTNDWMLSITTLFLAYKRHLGDAALIKTSLGYCLFRWLMFVLTRFLCEVKTWNYETMSFW